MPRYSVEFGSALPEVAEMNPFTEQAESAAIKRREQSPLEKAQLMWDAYQDIKTAWVDFVRSKRSVPRQKDSALPRLRDEDNPFSREFRATPEFQKLHARLAELWNDKPTQEAWRHEMRKQAEQWADVNGSWAGYLAVRERTGELERAYDDLQKEKFEERGKPARSSRRTLGDDLIDVELELSEARAEVDALFKKSPELAAKILASELAERRKEWHSPEGFMWFRSRREILETVDKILTNQETLRLIVLEGEAGTGKTTLAEMLSRHFTGQPALHVEVGEKTKADRALFADEKLEAGSSPTVYKPVLYALTGKKRPTDPAPGHKGRAVFIDEFNKMSNDEAGIAATVLDRCRVGRPTGYHQLGADPDDAIQPKALALAAQNPAGGRFRGRTDFTPEVKRKLEVVQVEYFPQSSDDPELFEAFLAVLQDSDGRVRAKKEEVGPAWRETEDATKKIKQDKLLTGENAGGALWRLANMLHESYENLAHRPNAITQSNPDAWIGGRVLPPGDIFKWLKEYQTEVKAGASLEHFLSSKFMRWLETSFHSAADAGDRQLYLELAARFGLAAESSGEYKALPETKIKPDFLTEREAAELSPRVPRKIYGLEAVPPPRPPEFAKAKFDLTDQLGGMHRGLEVRLDSTDAGTRYVQIGTKEPVYEFLGIIKECAKAADFVGKSVLADMARPEKKIAITNLLQFERHEPPHEIMVQNALNPYHEAWAAAGVPPAQNPERIERKTDLRQAIAESVQLYADNNLADWEASARTADLNNLTPDKRQLTTELLAEGYEVVGVMPGREAMLKQINEAMQRLKPLWIKDGKQETLVDTYIWDHLSQELFGAMLQAVKTKTKAKQPLEANEEQLEQWLDSLPMRPYLELTLPTQKPPADTCNLICTAAEPEQQAMLKAMQRTRPQLRVMHPGEYALTQALFTRHASRTPHPMITPDSLDPLDKDTFTRFIDLPVSSAGLVPGGCFDPDDRQLEFCGGDADDRNPRDGFRLSVRVEL